MRLLLLLSALLSALSGITGTRATAQPVQASAPASIAVTRAVAVLPASSRFVAASYTSRPPLRLALPRPAAVIADHALYAERRRE